jgi:hypothetical protein
VRRGPALASPLASFGDEDCQRRDAEQHDRINSDTRDTVEVGILLG